MRRIAPYALLLLAFAPVAAQSPAPVRVVVDRAIAAMGGDSTLRAIHSVRMEVMTQWMRTTMANRPFLDFPSFERHADLRDYPTKSWRNTRSPLGAGTPIQFPVVVRDSIAVVRSFARPGATAQWQPLSVAYVDDRRQLFAFAPERLVLTLREDRAATLLADTLIDGAAHARVAATVDGYQSVTFFRRRDGFPAMVRFLADETNDFGLAQWGLHEVEFWYSKWSAISREQGAPWLPLQRDVNRVGVPYKRMTILSLAVNAPAPADSFAISDSLVQAYLNGPAAKAMWDVNATTVDTSTKRSADGNFVTAFPAWFGSGGAVRISGRWMMLESGVGHGVPEKVAAWAARTTPDTPLGGAFATTQANGGLPWMLAQRHTVVASQSLRPYLPAILHRPIPTGMTIVTAARWLRIGSDSVWVEPLPGGELPGAIAIYSPTLRWLYHPAALSPEGRAHEAALVARLAARNLPVALIGGSGRGIAVPYEAGR